MEDERNALQLPIKSRCMIVCPCHSHAQLRARKRRQTDIAHVVQDSKWLPMRYYRRCEAKRPAHIVVTCSLAMSHDDEPIKLEPAMPLVHDRRVAEILWPQDGPPGVVTVVIKVTAAHQTPSKAQCQTSHGQAYQGAV
eukprot:scaffold10803_cov133-Isochrysis_galbana.AAC.1